MQPLWLTIHTTGNENPGANAEMHSRYLLTKEAIDRQVLWHGTVDSTQIIQHLPWDEAGWHAGDGYNGDGNRKSIGIELCVNRDGDFAATQRLAARLVAHLVTTIPSLKPFPECVVQHNKWSGKDCPHQLRATPGAWEGFLRLCEAEIAKLQPPEPTGVRVTVNGKEIACNPEVKDGTTRVDLRPLAVALGAKVEWDAATHTAKLTR